MRCYQHQSIDTEEYPVDVCPNCSRIATLEAENARLREALEIAEEDALDINSHARQINNRARQIKLRAREALAATEPQRGEEKDDDDE